MPRRCAWLTASRPKWRAARSRSRPSRAGTRWNSCCTSFPRRRSRRTAIGASVRSSTFTFPLKGGHEIAMGFDSDYTQGYLRETQKLPTAGTFTQGVHYDYAVAALVLAPYLHTEWRLTHTLRATAGLRLEHTAFNYDTRTSSDTVGRFQRPADRRDTFLTVTPKLGLVYAPNETRRHSMSRQHGARGHRKPPSSIVCRTSRSWVTTSPKRSTASSSARAAPSVTSNSSSHSLPWKRDTSSFATPTDSMCPTEKRGIGVSNGTSPCLLFPWAEIASGGTYARHVYDFSRPVIELGDRGHHQGRRRRHRAASPRQYASYAQADARDTRRARVGACGRLLHRCRQRPHLSRPRSLQSSAERYAAARDSSFTAPCATSRTPTTPSAPILPSVPSAIFPARTATTCLASASRCELARMASITCESYWHRATVADKVP